MNLLKLMFWKLHPAKKAFTESIVIFVFLKIKLLSKLFGEEVIQEQQQQDVVVTIFIWNKETALLLAAFGDQMLPI
ncbi:hypothetical protein D3C85_1588800 [compost metagenome]